MTYVKNVGRPKLSLLERLYLIEVMKGLVITIRHMALSLLTPRTHRAVIEYPEERRQYSNRFRGVHILTQRADGNIRCTACMLCATNCPAECISITAAESPNPAIEKYPARYEIDMLRCIFCGMCVEACPCEAIIMSGEFDEVYRDIPTTVRGIDYLMKRPGLAKAPKGYRPGVNYP